MIDNDTFDAQLATEMRAYTSSARLEANATALAHALAVQYPRRRLVSPRLLARQALAWIALGAVLVALALAAVAIGTRPSVLPQAGPGLLAFERGPDIYLADEATGRVVKVDGPGGDLYLGSWSPDGRWLSFGTESRVHLLDAATLAVRAAPTPYAGFVVSPTPPAAGGPSAAPGPVPPPTFNAAGWLPEGHSLILHLSGTAGDLNAVDVVDGTTIDLKSAGLCHVSISPDARYAAAVDQTSIDLLGPHQGAIVIVDLATSARTAIADFGGLGCGYYFGSDAPTWSPDSERLAIVTTDTLRIIRRDGSEPLDIATLEFPGGNSVASRGDVRPAWSPDGKWIGFASSAGLEVVRPDGSERHVLVSGRRLLGSFAWTPDSSHLEYGISVDSASIEGFVLSSVDVQSGETQAIELAQPWVLAFARQPVTAETPQTTLP